MMTYCGYVALVGRPNVGKSTLLNALVKQKLSITSNKPQTTRHRIIGVHTEELHQFVYVDTPGIHQKSKKALNSMMNKNATTVLRDVDAVVFIVEGTRWLEADEFILKLIKQSDIPSILVINKIDKIKDKKLLLPFLQIMAEKHDFKAIIPLSAKTRHQLESLEPAIQPLLPEGPHVYGEDQVTDRSVKFLCAELLREKIFRATGEELPYSVSVEIESFKEEETLTTIHALILVDRESHKRMIIGDGGSKLKELATQARLDMETLLQQKVFLKCWCKVKSGWNDNERLLKQLGYDH